MGKFHMRTWWQAGLAWGTAMLAVYLTQDALAGQLSTGRALKDVLVWESAGILFGLLLTTVMSLLTHRNLFRDGFPKKQGDR